MRSRRLRKIPLRKTQRNAVEWIAALEARRLLAAAPSVAVSTQITVPAGKSIQVPITGDAAGGGSLAYTISRGSGVSLSAALHDADNPWLNLDTTLGALRFQLLADIAPNTIRTISGLVESGYYDGLDFHRIVNVNGFVYAQGGDPNGDGTGGPAATFDDEFSRDALFTGSGQLATANVTKGATGKDANGSQFIVTGAPARSLDFNHTIFGQLVRGQKTLSSILNASTQSFKPTTAIVIKQASIVDDASDAVLQLRAGNKIGTSSVSVTARDAAGRATTRTILVNVVRDTDPYANTPPILQTIAPITAQPGQTIVIPIRALDLEGDDYDIAGDYVGSELASTRVDQLAKQITVTLTANAKGPIELEVGVKGANAVSRGDINMAPGGRPDQISSGLYDTQKITIAVGDVALSNATAARTEFIARPQVTLADKLIATFASATDTSASDFAARINWGDGNVTFDTRVREVRDGQFAIYGTHAFSRVGLLPITVNVDADNGAAAQILTQVRVAESTALDGRVLSLTGTDGDDVFSIVVDGTDHIIVNGHQPGWPRSSVDRIDARLYDGNDDLEANVAVLPDLNVDGGEGNDTVQAGPGDDTIATGNGNDIINGNGGNDLINSGEGNDTVATGSGKNVVYGEGGDDRIIGSGGRDLIYGGDGNDRLYGRGGDDTLDGGGGGDRIYGEDGNDLLIGGSGNDRIYGGTGDDVLFGKAGSDTLTGGPGNNRKGDDDPKDTLVDFI